MHLLLQVLDLVPFLPIKRIILIRYVIEFLIPSLQIISHPALHALVLLHRIPVLLPVLRNQVQHLLHLITPARIFTIVVRLTRLYGVQFLLIAPQHQILPLLLSLLLSAFVGFGLHVGGLDGADDLVGVGVPFGDFGDGLEGEATVRFFRVVLV